MVQKVIDIVGVSPQSFAKAADNAVSEAAKTDDVDHLLHHGSPPAGIVVLPLGRFGRPSESASALSGSRFDLGWLREPLEHGGQASRFLLHRSKVRRQGPPPFSRRRVPMGRIQAGG